MRKILAAAVASLAFIGAAYAATVEGVVQSVDPATRSDHARGRHRPTVSPARRIATELLAVARRRHEGEGDASRTASTNATSVEPVTQ